MLSRAFCRVELRTSTFHVCSLGRVSFVLTIQRYDILKCRWCSLVVFGGLWWLLVLIDAYWWLCLVNNCQLACIIQIFFRNFAAWKRCIRMSWQMPQEWVAIPSVVGWVVNAASWQNWVRVLAASCCRLARWHGCAGSTASICKIRKLLGLKRVKTFELNKHFEHVQKWGALAYLYI